MSVLPVFAPPALNQPQFLRLVATASRAPSGDNNQPWRFRKTDEGLDVLQHRASALPSDVHDLFSRLSLGAAIENIVLAAGREGLAADVECATPPFVSIRGNELVAHLRFLTESAPEIDDLALAIDARCTNRRPYERAPLTPGLLERLSGSLLNDSPPAQWLTQTAEKQRLARLVVAADRVRFETQAFHEEFHRVLRYTPQQAETARDGLDIRTFEAPPATSLLFRCLRPWSRMQFANRIGLSRMMAAATHKLVICSGAIGLLCAAADDERAFLQAGRSLQRLWLAATREGLAFQPLGALPLFLFRQEVLGLDSFPTAQLKVITALRTPFTKLFPTAEGLPVMLFRIGRAPAPSARSLRHEPAALLAGSDE